jgi:RNA polymerase sigma-70 factor (ECF subfamily)
LPQTAALKNSVENQDTKLLSLIEGCIAQDRKSQRGLYEMLYPYGMSISLRYARDEDEAMGILNESFMKVFTRIQKYDLARNSFKGWFKKILINTAIDYFNKNKIYYQQNLEIETIPEPNSTENIENNLRYEDILRCVHRLSPAYRTIFNLFVIDGFSHEEIARQVGISVGTSKSNLAKAREKLRQMLKKTYASEYRESF